MKGVILAGGTGSRMYPCTKVTNKHLLPVYNKPMIYYPLKTFIDAGIKEILIVSGPGHSGHFVNLLGSGREFGVKLSYEIQDEAGGIAQAIGLAENFTDKEPFAVILGDNIFEDSIKEDVKNFGYSMINQKKCKIFLKEVGLKAAKRFGIAVVEGDKIIYVEEKPENPKSNLAMTGLYMFDSSVFEIIKNLRPSARGELEVTDTIAEYVKYRNCFYTIMNGFWSDAGTFESMNRASNLVRAKEMIEDDYWSDNDDFAETFKFPSKEDNPSDIIEKLSQLSKKQSEILDYISKKK
ncbi:NTP transferase domain-containing protein [Candidatus Pacearchaeota archaeon]|nr:NTP transferase domain-containing protein [Candidatus Pacearchaeota archaeon]